MDKKVEDSRKKSSQLGKVLLTIVTVVSLVVVVVAIARLTPITKRFYTDADSIRVPARGAHTRDILWQPARPLSELVNTTADDYEPRLSADGLTLFFVRGKAGDNAEIYTSVRSAEGWSDPAPLVGVNSEYDDLGPEPSRDGTSLYFYSDRPGGYGGYDIFVAHKGVNGWQDAINLGPAVNCEFNDYGPALTPDGEALYFASNRPEPVAVPDPDAPDPNAWSATLREDLYQRDYDLYMSAIVDGAVGESQRLDELSTPMNDGAPAISSFGDFLYFASDRTGGHGAFDLYRSRRLRGNHEAPINLGPSVNTIANELDPGLSLGGYALYFSSDRPTEQIAADQKRAYDLYYTTSREVFSEVEQNERPPINWAALWSQIGPNLLWILLAILLLLLLWALLRDMRGRRLSLLAKCLLASATAHLLMLLLFNVWEVTASIAKEFQRRGRIQIALASPTAGSDVFTQIRGDLTAVETPQFQEVQSERQETALPMKAQQSTTEMDVARHQMVENDQPEVSHQADDAIVRHENEMPPPPDLEQQQVAQVEFDTALPQDQSRVEVQESRAVDAATPVEITPDRAVDQSMDATLQQPSEMAMLVPTDSESMDSEASQDQQSIAAATQPSDAVPSQDMAQATLTPTQPKLDIPSASDLTLPRVADERLPERAEANPAIAARSVAAPRRHLEQVRPSESVQSGLQQLAPQAVQSQTQDESFAPNPVAQAQDAKPTSSTTALDPSAASAVSQLPMNEVALAAPSSATMPNVSETSPTATTAKASAVRATFDAEADEIPPEVTQARMAPASSSQTSVDQSFASEATQTLTDSSPEPINPDLSVGANPSTVMPDLPTLALSSLEEAKPDEKVETATDIQAAQTESPRATLEDSVRLVDATPVETYLNPAAYENRDNERARSLAEMLVPVNREAKDNPPSLPAVVPLPGIALSPSALALDLGLPTDVRPPDDPYAQRSAENRQAMVDRMGGSKETEEAVAAALKWLAEHQSPDGHWDGSDFDDRCGQCDGTTEVLSEHAQTGLALLAFLGAGHTHMADGPYRHVVERGVRWLARQQRSNGDLRGEETMYSHGIASIALSEAYGMTKDASLRDAVQRAINFIDRARNKDEGGWRYDPGQVGDTSVLGWQVMALKSAAMNGIRTPAESFNTARKWLDKVSRRSTRGLYAYKPGRKYTPTMTAEGMFTQVLLGRSRDEDRMHESAEYLGENLPDWDEANTYYWYYGTLAMYQHQGPDWPEWNKAITEALVENQRKDGGAAGSWDPEGEWADEGGRVYQTAICALTLEVYYRYLPLYGVERPDDAIGEIAGTVMNTATNQPMSGAEIRLVLPDREPVTVLSGPDGRYKLYVPEVPDFFALSASHQGFLPHTQNVDAAMLTDTTLAMDFELTPSTEELVAIEPVPDVHHLGDNAFSGSINSQFQKESEGDHYERDFTLTRRQVPPYYNRAEIRMMAKGVQRRHRIVINGTTLEKRLEDAPRDGSFGEFVARFDASILRAGTNTLEVIAKPSDSDIDDFEFVNIQIRLAP